LVGAARLALVEADWALLVGIQMRRREFITLGVRTVRYPFVARAQRTEPTRKISFNADEAAGSLAEFFG
jgi:hypothetical protein